MGLLDSPSVGEVLLDGDRIDDLPQQTRDEIRNRVFGFVFQFYHLLPELNVLENVLTPLMIRHSFLSYWRRRNEFREQACEILEKVGLEGKGSRYPTELSGGEQQRVAIARAFVADVPYLLADEPTGNLDEGNAMKIMDLIDTLHKETGNTIIMITHDREIALRADKIYRLHRGVLESGQ